VGRVGDLGIARRWDAVVEAMRETIAAVSKVVQAGDEEPGRIGPVVLAHEHSTLSLMGLLFLDQSVTLGLLDELVLIAAQSQRHALLARQLIGGLPHGEVEDRVPGVVRRRLAQADEDEYRRLAELLVHLGLRDLLDELVSKALASANRYVREVGEDFGPYV
jgi:hypothetical protein